MAAEDAKKQTAAFNPVKAGKPGPGRKKGIPNRTTTLLKDAILMAAELAGNEYKKADKGQGGLVGYLQVQALENPGPFMSLVSKVLPMQVTGENGDALIVQVVKFADDTPAR